MILYLVAAGLALALPGGEVVAADGPSVEDFEKTLKSFQVECDRVFPALHDAIKNGTAEEGWLEAAKPDAEQWLDRYGLQRYAGKTRYSDATNLNPSMLPPFPPKSLAAREWAHYVALWEFRNSVTIAYCAKVEEFAEKIWLAAKTAEDLEPADEAFATLSESLGQPLRFTALWRVTPLPGVILSPPKSKEMEQLIAAKRPLMSALDEAASTAILLRKPAFFIPGPESKPEEWATAWTVSRRLIPWKLPFLQRPRIAVRLADFDVAYRKRVETLYRKVEPEVLADAPYGRYEASLDELGALLPGRVPGPVRARNGMVPHMPNPNYMQLMVMSPPPSGDNSGANSPVDPDPAIGEISKKVAGLQAVAKWRHYQLAGDSEKATEAWDTIWIGKLINDSPGLLALTQPGYMEQQTASHWLGGLSQANDYQAEASPAFAAWEKAFGPDWASIEDANTGPNWAALTRHPESLDLFELRDREVRAVLAKVLGDRDAWGGILAEIFQAAVEKTFKDGNVEASGRLIAIDAAANILPKNLHRDYRAALAAFESAATDPSTAPQMYREVLAKTTSPACAALAARRLKSGGK